MADTESDDGPPARNLRDKVVPRRGIHERKSPGKRTPESPRRRKKSPAKDQEKRKKGAEKKEKLNETENQTTEDETSEDERANTINPEIDIKANRSPLIKRRSPKGQSKQQERIWCDQTDGAGEGQRLKPFQTVSETAGKENAFNCNTIFFIIIACVVGAAVFHYWPALGTPIKRPVAVTTTDYFKEFKTKFDNQKARYPSQSPRFWRTIGAPIKRVLSKPDPVYPAVILLTIPEGHTQSAVCLAQQVTMDVNSVFNITLPIYINSEKLNHVSPAKMKLDLDMKMKSTLENSRGVVVDNIESLPSEAALLFHGYCDGDNAPFKNVVIFLVLHLTKPVEEVTERSIEQHLSKLWAGLGEDEIPALLSRLANNKAIFNPEEQGHDITCDL